MVAGTIRKFVTHPSGKNSFPSTNLRPTAIKMWLTVFAYVPFFIYRAIVSTGTAQHLCNWVQRRFHPLESASRGLPQGRSPCRTKGNLPTKTLLRWSIRRKFSGIASSVRPTFSDFGHTWDPTSASYSTSAKSLTTQFSHIVQHKLFSEKIDPSINTNENLQVSLLQVPKVPLLCLAAGWLVCNVFRMFHPEEKTSASLAVVHIPRNSKVAE